MAEIKIRTLTADEIECRVGQCGKVKNDKVWCSVLLYKDARCDQRILDELFGAFGWKRKHEVVNNQLCCTVSIKDKETNEWIDKQDVGTESNTEAVKGSFSDAFKRACFNWGIGRELYTAPKIFIWLNGDEYDEVNGKPKVKAKTDFIVSEIGYDDKKNINRLVIVDKDGVVRFSLGQQSQQPVQGQQQAYRSEEEQIFEETFNDYIIPALKQARIEEDVKRIWDDYATYQKVQKFINAVNARLAEIRKAA